MTILIVVLFAGLGLGALVFVWRAVSCARFRRALRSYAATVEGGFATATVGSPESSSVVDARHRFEPRGRDVAGRGTPRSA